jgi:hypothetical protein
MSAGAIRSLGVAVWPCCTEGANDTRRIHHLCLLRSAGLTCTQKAALHLLGLQYPFGAGAESRADRNSKAGDTVEELSKGGCGVTRDDKGFFVIGVFVSTLIWVVILVCCKHLMDWTWQQRAIKHNAAEWRVDPKTGQTTFMWLTKPDAEK